MSPLSSYELIRAAMASMPADVSNDAIGGAIPSLEEIYAPETHAAALDPKSPIVQGIRGTGKSFWAAVLGDTALREAAAMAYPQLGLDRLAVKFGYTGIEGSDGIGRDRLDQCVPPDGGPEEARAFFWATILRAQASDEPRRTLRELLPDARDPDRRNHILAVTDLRLRQNGKTLLIVYDALDTVATSWPRRRMLTQALLEVVWAMRAYRSIRVKLFLRPDQLEDDEIRFVELPKLQTGAVRLTWSGADLYGLLFARLSMGDARESFTRVLSSLDLRVGSRDDILTRKWSLGYAETQQRKVMSSLAGPFMADGTQGHKKGNTYDWPLTHLSDAFKEVTPRSFLGLMIAAAKYGAVPVGRAISPVGIQHGLRAASKTRVEQLHQEFPWIKGVLAPLAGLLLPKDEQTVFNVWRRAKTIENALADADKNGYIPPIPPSLDRSAREQALYVALERIGVMMRRSAEDQRIDMPDLFRVAAKLLKKGGTAPA